MKISEFLEKSPWHWRFTVITLQVKNRKDNQQEKVKTNNKGKKQTTKRNAPWKVARWWDSRAVVQEQKHDHPGSPPPPWSHMTWKKRTSKKTRNKKQRRKLGARSFRPVTHNFGGYFLLKNRCASGRPPPLLISLNTEQCQWRKINPKKPKELNPKKPT